MANKLIDGADAASKLRAARAILDESQEVFAARIGCSSDWLRLLESGAARPNLTLALTLEELTGITPGEWHAEAKEAVA